MSSSASYLQQRCARTTAMNQKQRNHPAKKVVPRPPLLRVRSTGRVGGDAGQLLSRRRSRHPDPGVKLVHPRVHLHAGSGQTDRFGRSFLVFLEHQDEEREVFTVLAAKDGTKKNWNGTVMTFIYMVDPSSPTS